MQEFHQGLIAKLFWGRLICSAHRGKIESGDDCSKKTSLESNIVPNLKYIVHFTLFLWYMYFWSFPVLRVCINFQKNDDDNA